MCMIVSALAPFLAALGTVSAQNISSLSLVVPFQLECISTLGNMDHMHTVCMLASTWYYSPVNPNTQAGVSSFSVIVTKLIQLDHT